jgi:glucokinase
MRFRAGVDLGGTKIQAVVVDDTNAVVGQARNPTPTSGGPETVAKEIMATLNEAAAAAEVEPSALAGIGVGSPGAVDSEAGTVAHARNLPGWDGVFPLAQALSEAVGPPVYLANDVDVALDAEVALGAARPYASILGVWWGTGVGGGIILDGKRWDGRGAAGELGHTVVRLNGARCGCGRRGCVEAYAGRAAMEARARRVAAKGTSTRLFEIMEERGRTQLASGVWAQALDEEDDLAVNLLERAVAALGAGIASAVNLLDVEAVVIGGGLGTRLGQPYADRLVTAMASHLFLPETPPAVHTAALGDLGGAIGGALLVGVQDASPAEPARVR